MTTTLTKLPPAPSWDLDSIFPGGSRSESFKQFRQKLRSDCEIAAESLGKLPTTLDDQSQTQWQHFILTLQDLLERIDLVKSFAGCLAAANVADSMAQVIVSEGDLYLAEWEKLKATFEPLTLKQSDAAWEKLVTSPELVGVRFFLDELRFLAKAKMRPELETLGLDLAVDGYHAWGMLYSKMAGDLRVDFEENGETSSLSLGQLATKMADRNRAVRKQAFEKMTQAWVSREEYAAKALNSIAGFRLALYKHRGWESPLYEPLVNARMKPESLDAMWSAVEKGILKLAPYIQAKKSLLGIDKFTWYDEFAPCGVSGKLYTYDEASQFIIENTKSFSTHLAGFCKLAVEKKWVEAEDRAGKAGGAFCTGMGPLKQTRVFMTYAGTYDNLSTLAHELGHAYHSFVLNHAPFFASIYPMTLAETASIFTESLVTDAALSAATDNDERLMLLDQKLQSAYILFCDLYSRYLFETSFYAERRQGIVEAARLRELMTTAQERAFGGLLDESGYHPLFWGSKMHFYATDAPFYNFPYTFGFLFAQGVYARAKQEGASFADRYRALLADTGSMTSEQVAKKHLGVDLTKEEFWSSAVNLALADVNTFVNLAG
jgi:pepF/M3 family oligoendopeptidase